MMIRGFNEKGVMGGNEGAFTTDIIWMSLIFYIILEK